MNATPPADGAPAARPTLKAHARAMLVQQWGAFHPIAALYGVPAFAVLLAAGLLLDQPGPAILAASGAFSAGFGAFQRVSRVHMAPMVLAAICMAAATSLGTMAGGGPYLYAAAVAVAAFSLGLAASFGTGPWWVLLQGAVFLIVAGSRPAGVEEALARGLLVLAGGLVQSLSIAGLRALAPRGFPPLSPPGATPQPQSRAAWISQAKAVLTPRAPEFRYAALLGLASGAALLIAQGLALPNSYWVAMTVMLILRRGGAETINRGVLRMAGTLAGAGAATLVAALLRPDPILLVVLVTAAAWGSYAFQWVNYGTFSISITSYIAFLLSLEGLPEAAVARDRILATLIGGVFGMVALGLARLARLGRQAVFSD